MSDIATARSGKTARDENFPVASFLIDPDLRPVIHAFYRFVRAADDVADSPTLTSEEKLARLDHLEAALRGRARDPDAAPLRRAFDWEGRSPRHALDLLEAFRLDVVKRRYADLPDLIDYCRLSAMPVGRFVLDVHGEARSLWPASDALCAALQVINHLQDCGEDYRKLDRVYLPLNILRAHGANVEMLSEDCASDALKGAIAEIADHAAALVEQGGRLIPQIANARLAAEIAAIHALAQRLAAQLRLRDPLKERIRLSNSESLRIGGYAAARALMRRLLPGSAWSWRRASS
jgi:hydroxysqualene synthase